MAPFGWVDLLLVIGISQGLFLAIIIAKTEGSYQKGNLQLIKIILLAVLMMSGKIFVGRFQSDWVIRLATLSDTSIFLFGPLLLQYLTYLMDAGGKTTQLAKWHWIPGLAHTAYFIWSCTLSLSCYLETVYIHYPWVPFFIELLGMLSLTSYWFVALRKIRQTSFEERFVFKYLRPLQRYLFTFLGVTGMLWLLWLLGFVSLHLVRTPLAFFSYNLMWISASVFFYLVGFYCLRNPFLLKIDGVVIKNRLNQREVDHLSKEVTRLMDMEKVYLQDDLTLIAFAQQLNRSTNDVSWLLNHVYGKSFNEFVNEARIEAFLEKIKENRHLKQTLLSLAFEAGFRSKSTFNKAFKAHMNLTPKDFVKQHFEAA